MTFEVVGGMTCPAVAPLSPQRAFKRRDTFLATLGTAIIVFAQEMMGRGIHWMRW